jgi:two-component system nitrogen regulation response regulator NtrX
LVANGSFREDLFYRLSVLNVCLPPLRERKEDIKPLCEHFLRSLRRENGLMVREIDRKVLDIFHNWSWPGNIRELRNVLEAAAASADTEILKVENLPEHLIADTLKSKNEDPFSAVNVLRQAKKNSELALLQSSLRKNSWNKSRTARELGISRPLLYALIKKYSLTQPSKENLR